MRYREMLKRIEEAQQVLAPIPGGHGVPDDVAAIVHSALGSLDDGYVTVSAARKQALDKSKAPQAAAAAEVEVVMVNGALAPGATVTLAVAEHIHQLAGAVKSLDLPAAATGA